MGQVDFIFSKQLKWRLVRHLSFWLGWYLFQLYLYSFAPTPMLTRLSFWARIRLTAGEGFLYLFPQMFLAYTLMYWVIPKMLVQAKYLLATITVLGLAVSTGAFSAFISVGVIESLRQRYLQQYAGHIDGVVHTPLNAMFYMALLSGLRGSITIGGMAAAIKLMKHFYEKQQQSLMLEQQAILLIQQKALAELQSLKAQLHPHFLFNTLNNIYSHAQDTAPVAADMLMGLSTLLRYMLYSCNAPLVPLKQELNMLLEYIELEKQRYGNQLEVAIQMPLIAPDLLIAPLLILPFIENCFKHGASDMLEHPWINIQLHLVGEAMHLKLINGKAPVGTVQIGGIGIENARRRLELLYPSRHGLQIVAEQEMYIVNLNLELNRAEKHELTLV